MEANLNGKKIERFWHATSYINQGDSVGLKVMIAAYDSTEAMKIRYWEDDSSEYVKPHGSRDKSNMKTFNGNARILQSLERIN